MTQILYTVRIVIHENGLETNKKRVDSKDNQRHISSDWSVALLRCVTKLCVADMTKKAQQRRVGVVVMVIDYDINGLGLGDVIVIVVDYGM